MPLYCHFNQIIRSALIIGLLLVLFLTGQDTQAGESLYIVPPQGEVLSGKKARFHLFVHNQGTQEITTRAYGRISVTLVTSNDVHRVAAVPIGAELDFSVTIPAGGFIKQEYAILVPETMGGHISMSLDGFDAGPVLFAAKAAPEPVKEEPHQVSLGGKNDVFQPFTKNLSPYEPVYFLFGVDPGTEKSKFQLSFKYKLFNDPLESQTINTFIDGFHLAYTQTSYWDLSSDSKPFDDTSYKPEIFYLVPKIDLNTPWIKAFGVQTGFQHESNGKGGDDSRSTNFAYVEPTIGFHLFDDYFLAVSPRIWAYVGNDDETNGNLDDYRGYFQFQAKIGSPEGLVLDTRTRWADKGPSFQADLSYPLTFLFSNKLNLYLHLQYFNGYAERLVDYREHEEIFRIGFSLIR